MTCKRDIPTKKNHRLNLFGINSNCGDNEADEAFMLAKTSDELGGISVRKNSFVHY